MKLLRYGEKGSEKPGLLDADNQIRDLSGHVQDITGQVLSPESLATLAAIDPASLRSLPGSRVLVLVWGKSGSLSASG